MAISVPALDRLSGVGTRIAAFIVRHSSARNNTRALLLVNCLLLVVAVGMLDYWAGRQCSMAIFYLIPVAAAAWWAGRLFGILLSIASAIVWHYVHVLHTPGAPLAISFWNEGVYLAFYLITAYLISTLRDLVRQQEFLTRTDPLTRAIKARVFYEAAHLVLEHARRTGRPFTMAFLDLDDFKEVNRLRGRAAGDQILRCVADTLRRNLRSTDVISRLGGDEFGILLPETDSPFATTVLKRLQLTLSQKIAECGSRVSASIGAATFVNPADIDEAAKLVTAQLAAAKSEGKGQVRHTEVTAVPDAPAVFVEEQRATPRFLCNRMARVHRPKGGTGQPEYALVHDLSTEGVGLHTERSFPQGTVLTIEALYATDAKPLLARVVRSTGRDDRWFHGCVLAASLDSGDLGQWLAGSSLHTDLAETRGGIPAGAPASQVLAKN